MNRNLAIQSIITVLLAYPDSKVDREPFIKLAAIALEDYSEFALQTMCCPKRGLIASSKFMPSIAEMRQFCREVVNPKLMISQRKIEPRETPLEINEEERQRMLDKFKKLSYSLGSVNERNGK
jgi:hypothetical protein